MEIFENLGLSLTSIVFHTINLVILIVALHFLLYKPVKKMIANHKAKLNDIFAQNQKLNAEANEMKDKYDRLLGEMKQETMRISAEATEKAQAKSDEIIGQAKEQATTILETAKKEAAAEKLRLRNDFRDSAGHLAIDIAEKILEREVSEEDNKKIIDSCLQDWEK